MNSIKNCEESQKNKHSFFTPKDTQDEFDELFKCFLRDREMLKLSSKLGNHSTSLNSPASQTFPSKEKNLESTPSNSPVENKNETVRKSKILRKLHEQNCEIYRRQDNNNNRKITEKDNVTSDSTMSNSTILSNLPDEIFERQEEIGFVSKYEIIPNRRVSMACKPDYI